MSTVRFFACAALSAAMLSAAPQAAVEGRDYEPINPPLPVYAAAGKIEVIEFFNFSCPHCFRLLGPFAQWKHARDTADIEFRRQPVIFRRANGLYAKLFYALEAADSAKNTTAAYLRRYIRRANCSTANPKFWTGSPSRDWSAKK